MVKLTEHIPFIKQAGWIGGFVFGAVFVANLASTMLPQRASSAGTEEVVLKALQEEAVLMRQLAITLNQRSAVFEGMIDQLDKLNEQVGEMMRDQPTRKDWERVEKKMTDFARETERWHNESSRRKGQ